MEDGESGMDTQKLAERIRAVESLENDNRLGARPHTAKDSSKGKEVQFRALHAVLIGFLVLLAVLHTIGIYLFTSGFLLSRLVLPDHSTCSQPPVDLYGSHEPGSISQGCWHPKTFEKAVVIIIDALRYDFTVPFSPSANQPDAQHFHDALPFLYETAVEQPKNAFLRPFIADPPTTTLQRLKGLTVGTLPTFIEGGSNFAGFAIDEDNLIGQLVSGGKNIVHLGDDTWHSLFEGHFDANLTRAYDSFNVKDLHTVDNGVTEHLIPLLHPSNLTKWDVVIGHYLGVDHAGHVFGPGHSAMRAKLQQMDAVLREVSSKIDKDTLLVVMGDHGMDSKGDHGGESDDEVEAALWMYSPRNAFGRTSSETIKPPATAKHHRVAQIDLVPTLALLLGLPIPFNNLGAPIDEAFIQPNGNDYQNLALVNRLASAQIKKYQERYSIMRRLDSDSLAVPWILWDAATRSWEKYIGQGSKPTVEQWKRLASEFATFQQHNLNVFRDLWARFDLVNMGLGILVALSTLGVVVAYGCSIRGDLTSLNSSFLIYGVVGFVVGLLSGTALWAAFPSLGLLRTTTFAAAMSSNIGLFAAIHTIRDRLSSIIPRSLWSWLCVITVILLSVGFAANSFTVWEDEILLFFLALFGSLMFAQSFRLRDAGWSGYYHSVMFMLMIRLASLSRLCRDEQFPYCKTTYYASATTSTIAPWQLAVSYLIAIILPSAIKSYYTLSHSYHGSAPFWIGFAFRLSLLLIAVYWTLQAAEDGDWLNVDKEKVKTSRQYLAQLILYVAVGAGTATFGWQAPMIDIDTVEEPVAPTLQSKTSRQVQTRSSTSNDSSKPLTGEQQPATKRQLILRGTTNLYGSHFAILPMTVLLIPLLLFQKPMGQAALACVTIAILSLFELLYLLFRQPQRTSTSAFTLARSQATAATLGSTVLALTAHLLYFKTGHQAALASIQWDSAFIPIATVRYPWTPIFVILNTFAGQILCAAAVPGVVLWRRSYVFDRAAQRGSKFFSKLDLKGLEEDESTDEPRDSSAPASPYSTTTTPKQKDTPGGQAARERTNLLTAISRAWIAHVLVYVTINLATTLWAAHLRRHLMVYRVFSPRWMLGCVGLVIAEVFGICVGVAGVGWTVSSLGGMFGW